MYEETDLRHLDERINIEDNSQYIKKYEHIRAKLKELLGDDAVYIEHVGTTAVNDIFAYPVIDVAIAASTEKLRDRICEKLLSEHGFTECKSKNDEILIRKGTLEKPSYYIHLTLAQSDFFRTMLRFRDELKIKPKRRDAYENIHSYAKLEYRDDLDKYHNAKTSFIRATAKQNSVENYDDEITPSVYNNKELTALLEQHNIEAVSKDMLGVRVGLNNFEGTELILKFKQYIPTLAKMMPYHEQYHQSILDGEKLKQTMIDADIIDLEGDYAQCRGGITTAQNLPNNDKLSVKTGGGRRNVYHRQVRMSGDKEKQQKILQRLVTPELHKYYSKEADHIFVIGHENGHSLGPNSEYQNALGSYKHIIEEHKADTISLTFMPQYVKNGVIDAETLKKVYVSYIVGRMFLSARPHQMLPHRMGELIQFNYLLQHGAINFDDKGLLHIDFAQLDPVLHNLLDETIRVQLSKSPQTAEEFVEKYTVWTDISERIASVHRELGIKPYKRIIRHF